MWNPHITAIPNMRRCMWDDMVTCCSVWRERISMNLSIHQLSPTRPAQCRSDTEYLVFLSTRYVSFICILLFGPVLGPVFIFIGSNMWNRQMQTHKRKTIPYVPFVGNFYCAFAKRLEDCRVSWLVKFSEYEIQTFWGSYLLDRLNVRCFSLLSVTVWTDLCCEYFPNVLGRLMCSGL